MPLPMSMYSFPVSSRTTEPFPDTISTGKRL